MSDELVGSKALQTPFMRQWFAAKERYPDALIFFRMGDFYELFLDDAVKAAALLGLTLTSRNKGEPDEIPMAGAPHHQAHVYVARALAHGLKVAICEQMADPAKVKGIVPRAEPLDRRGIRQLSRNGAAHVTRITSGCQCRGTGRHCAR